MKKLSKENKLIYILIFLLSIVSLTLLFVFLNGGYEDESYVFNEIFSDIGKKVNVDGTEHEVSFSDGVYYIDATIVYNNGESSWYQDLIKGIAEHNLKFDKLIVTMSKGYSDGEKVYAFKDRVVSYKDYKKSRKAFK